MAAQSQDSAPDSRAATRIITDAVQPRSSHARGGMESTPPSLQPTLSSLHSSPPVLFAVIVCLFYSAPLLTSPLPCCCLPASSQAPPHPPNIHLLPIASYNLPLVAFLFIILPTVSYFPRAHLLYCPPSPFWPPVPRFSNFCLRLLAFCTLMLQLFSTSLIACFPSLVMPQLAKWQRKI